MNDTAFEVYNNFFLHICV